LAITKKISGAALICVVLVLLIGCGRRHEPDEYYVLVTANKAIPYWKTAAAGFFEATSQMKVKSEVVGPDNYDPNAQLDEFRRAVGKKPAGILLSATDPELFKGEIDSAISQGIPVITIDTDSPKANRLFFIGTNNYQAGLMGGEVAAKELKGKGNVIVFTMPNQVNLEERLNGYRKSFEKYPGIKIVRVIDIKGDPRIAFDQTQAVLDKKEPIDGFICLEAQGGEEVATVVSNANATGRVIVAMNTDEKTLDWIKKGVIAATIAQKPYTMGYVGVRMVDDYHHSQADIAKMANSKSPISPLPAYVDTGATLVDKNNVEEIQRLLQQSQAQK
jgi:ribose transport system substrate-binding protein